MFTRVSCADLRDERHSGTQYDNDLAPFYGEKTGNPEHSPFLKGPVMWKNDQYFLGNMAT